VPDFSDQLLNPPANWPNISSSKFITAAGIRWHVQRAGCGPTILLVHGTAGATHTWRTVLPLLTPWADVIAFELPGHGFTTGATVEQLSLPGMADAVAALVRALDAKPRIGVGHSAGAAVLLQLASAHEFKPQSIIGVNSALIPVNALGQMLLPLSRALFDTEALQLCAAAVLKSGAVARRLVRSTGSPLGADQEARYVALLADKRRVSAVLGMMTRWDLEALNATFPRLSVPLTLVHSQNEPWVPFRALLDATRSVPLRTVIDVTPAGHLIPDEKPQQLADIIASTFAEIASRSG